MFLIALIIGRINSYHKTIPCSQILYTGATYGTNPHPNTNLTAQYAACNADPSAWTAVKANLYNPSSVAEAMAGMQLSFGTSGFLALLLHAVAVEVYLGLTPGEGERLRRVGRERRAERGMGGVGDGDDQTAEDGSDVSDGDVCVEKERGASV